MTFRCKRYKFSEIEFRDINFSYESKGEQILNSINLNLKEKNDLFSWAQGLENQQ